MTAIELDLDQMRPAILIGCNLSTRVDSYRFHCVCCELANIVLCKLVGGFHVLAAVACLQ